MSDLTPLEETGHSRQYAANWHRLQDKSSRDRSRPSKSASEIIQDLRAFGPGQVPAWADLSNINKLCSQCASIDWDPVRVYLAVADGDEWYPKVPLYGGDISRSVKQVRDAACRLSPMHDDTDMLVDDAVPVFCGC